MWRNWQTRMIQVHVPEMAWRFKSSHPHQQLDVTVYSYARINAVLEMKVRDYFVQGCRGWSAFTKKAGKGMNCPRVLTDGWTRAAHSRIAGRTGGRPARMCDFCGQEFSARELRQHLSALPQEVRRANPPYQ
jgi:hypothetical protein